MEGTLEKPDLTSVTEVKTEAERLLGARKFAGEVEEKVREKYGVLRVEEKALTETAVGEKEALTQTQQHLIEVVKEVNSLFGQEQSLTVHEADLIEMAAAVRGGLAQLEEERRVKTETVEATRSERQGRLAADRAGEIKEVYDKREGEWAYLRTSLTHDRQQLAASSMLLGTPEMRAALGVIEGVEGVVERAQFVAEERKEKTVDEYRRIGEEVATERKSVNEKFDSNKRSIDEDVDKEKGEVNRDVDERKAKLEERLAGIETELAGVKEERARVVEQSGVKIAEEGEAREVFERQTARMMDLEATLGRVRGDINKSLGLLARVGETAREIADKGGELLPQVEGLLPLLDEREVQLSLAVEEEIAGLSARATEASEAILEVARVETDAARGVVTEVEKQIDEDLLATGQFKLNEKGVLVQIPLEGRDAILAFTDWLPVAQKARGQRDEAVVELQTRIMEIGTDRETRLGQLGRNVDVIVAGIENIESEARSSLAAARETVATLLETTKEAFGAPEALGGGAPEARQNVGKRLMAAAGRVFGGLFSRFK